MNPTGKTTNGSLIENPSKRAWRLVLRIEQQSLFEGVRFGIERMDAHMTSPIFEVFGRTVQVTGTEGGWDVFYLSSDGKKRPAKDLVVPSDIPEKELAKYLGDLCHEWATERYPTVRRLD